MKGLELFKQERARFVDELKKLPGLRVIPSQANYVMVELTGDKSTRELTKVLLIKYSLFIKDLSPKMNGGRYIRLAVRDTKDNDRLLAALKQEL